MELCDGRATHRARGEALQVRLVTLQQLLDHLEETLDEHVERLSVTGEQERVEGLHRDVHEPGGGEEG